MLQSKKIIIGVTGSIAAYKTAHLTRLLVKAGAEVRVIMTPGAIDFITPLTLATLSKNEVLSAYFDPKTGAWNNHVDLGLWADLLIIAPASANTLSKMASGLCDNLLMAVYLSARCKTAFAPAMDLDMYRHPSVRSNIELLQQRGNMLIPAESGELASGLHGEGRMAEPEHIVSFIEQFFSTGQPLHGKKAVVSAGPTHEPIDPVRFIGNHSTGKMGIALASRLQEYGASVTLVMGPSSEPGIPAGMEVVRVQSAADMFDAMVTRSADADILVMSAAVADYTPKTRSEIKLKKKSDEMFIELEKTRDILKELGTLKRPDQILVGFALETNNEEEHALEKLHKKNLDFIVLNSLNDPGAGFGTDTNKITILDRHGKTTRFELKSKKDVATDIVQKIIDWKN